MIMRFDQREIDKIYKRRDRYEIPDWQREEVWPVSKRRMLIDSILRGWSLPKLYFLKISDDPAEYEVVDGQQRLSAIFGFLDEEFELDDDQEMNFGGRSYAALPDALQDRFDDFKLQFDEIEDSTEEEIREYFGRLQQGLPLTTSEKLNAKVSKLRDWCKEKSKHQFFKKKVRISDGRYAYFDIIVKAAAIEIEQFDINLRLGELSDLFEQQANFSPNSASAWL